MTVSIWRYSHLALFLISSLFLIAAALSGLILSFDPISEEFKSEHNSGLSEINLSELIQSVNSNFDETLTVEIDDNSFLKASIITEGASKQVYVSPITGKQIGNVREKNSFFQFVTNFHRSLFLKTTGRLLVGIFSFFLLLIALSGIFLLAKRHGGFRHLFSKVHKDEPSSYWHVKMSRWFFIPIVIISVSGVFLSAERFSLLPTSKNDEESPKSQWSGKNALDLITLADITKLEFPFSEDEDEYFLIDHHSGKLKVNQFNGEVVLMKSFGNMHYLTHWMSFLHTGEGSIIWSVLLMLTSLAILFFMISGFSVFLKRRSKSLSKPETQTDKTTAEIIILVGSESGNTLELAHELFNSFLANDKKAYITGLNAYSSYPCAEHLIILTSTYGNGEAPANAGRFQNLLKTIRQENKLSYAVLGLGSTSYPNFCSYAIEVDSLLKQTIGFNELLPLVKINNQSSKEIQKWIFALNDLFNTKLTLPKTSRIRSTDLFIVKERTNLNSDDTFILFLEPKNNTLSFQSGDLLEVLPSQNEAPRAYSLAKYNNGILLCVKKHPFGVCSSYLADVKLHQEIEASVVSNPKFRFPTEGNGVMCVANGTGITPFIGMLNDTLDSDSNYLFWGIRTPESLGIYSRYLEGLVLHEDNLFITYSKLNKKYIQEDVITNIHLILALFKNGGVLMICGSLQMKEELFYLLEKELKSKVNKSLEYFISKGQIKSDCY